MTGVLIYTDNEDVGALNLYARRPGAFTKDIETAGWLLVPHAAVALATHAPSTMTLGGGLVGVRGGGWPGVLFTDHADYEKHDPAGKNNGSSRNGTRAKTV